MKDTPTTRPEDAPAKLTPRHGPASAFASAAQRVHFAYGAGIACLVVAILGMLACYNQVQAPVRGVVMDNAGNVIISPLEEIKPGGKMFGRFVEKAALAALQRNPSGLDYPKFASQIYHGKAWNDLQAWVEREKAYFTDKSLHQKVELGPITVGENSVEGKVYVMVAKGLLYRSGYVENARFVPPPIPFRMVFAFAPNPRIGEAGEYPFVVIDYKYEEVKP